MTARDSSAYGFYSVRLREGLRSGLPVIDSLTADSLMTVESDEELTIIEQIIGRKRPDTISVKEVSKPRTIVKDTVVAPLDTRKGRREQRRREREAKKNEDD
jgi:hypothetical protein